MIPGSGRAPGVAAESGLLLRIDPRMPPETRLTPEQADAAVAAILAGPEAAALRARTDALRRRLHATRRNRNLAIGAMLGFAAGCVLGGVAFDGAMSSGLVGLGLGALAGRLLAPSDDASASGRA